MKKKELKIKRYIAGFTNWLRLMNYAETSLQSGRVRLREFLEWSKMNKIESVEAITGEDVKQFFNYLSKRKNKRTGQVLSLATLRNYLTTLNRFARYLRLSESIVLEVPVKFRGQQKKPIVLLTKKEIEQLYEATDDGLLGMRNRAMLGVFYGCGLRRNEGIQLEVKDLLFDKNLLYIRKAKGGRERYVPIVAAVKNDILNYVQIGRRAMMSGAVHQKLFVRIGGEPIGGNGIYASFKTLLKKAKINKSAGIHTLRHSIATHLLLEGMKLSRIAKFLGHRSLESTQIYTHLKDEEI